MNPWAFVGMAFVVVGFLVVAWVSYCEDRSRGR